MGWKGDRFGRLLVGESTRLGDKLGVRSEKEGGVHVVSHLSHSMTRRRMVNPFNKIRGSAEENQVQHRFFLLLRGGESITRVQFKYVKL